MNEFKTGCLYKFVFLGSVSIWSNSRMIPKYYLGCVKHGSIILLLEVIEPDLRHIERYKIKYLCEDKICYSLAYTDEFIKIFEEEQNE